MLLFVEHAFVVAVAISIVSNYSIVLCFFPPMFVVTVLSVILFVVFLLFYVSFFLLLIFLLHLLLLLLLLQLLVLLAGATTAASSDFHRFLVLSALRSMLVLNCAEATWFPSTSSSQGTWLLLPT